MRRLLHGSQRRLAWPAAAAAAAAARAVLSRNPPRPHPGRARRPLPLSRWALAQDAKLCLGPIEGGASSAAGAAGTLASGEGAAAGGRPRGKVVVITGPTAVGKTAVSLRLAEALGGEIISADSVQVYRGLDIGSDKIAPEERRGVPHHLLDVIEPSQDFSAGDFYSLARAAAEDILARGKVPIVVGGTGFYLRWLLHGKPQTPASTPELQARVQAFMQQTQEAALAADPDLSAADLWEAHAKAIEGLGDPASADRLRGELNNTYRLSRMLEILLGTGQPLAALAQDRAAPLAFDFRCFFLNRPRLQLYDRVGARCEQMLQRGLLREARQLLRRGLRANGNCATKAIGYRQALECLQAAEAAGQPPDGEALVRLCRDIQTKSRNLCHSQLSWFRDEPLFHWIDADRGESEVVAELLARIAADAHEGKQEGVGLLSREEAKALRGYQSQLTLITRPDVQAAILADLAAEEP